MTGFERIASTLGKAIRGSAKAFFDISQGGFALLGITLAFTAIALSARPELRDAGEGWLMGWLQERQITAAGLESDTDATERATAVDLKELPAGQASLAQWISKKYRVAPEAVGAVVAEAYDIGLRTKLEPTLILAIAAIESGFNPFSQSPHGAQGLMQVMTRVHTDKFHHFGGKLAAFDPIANLRVGVKILQDCIARAGSLEGGLRLYVGATTDDDGGYATKVLAEQARLDEVAKMNIRPAAAGMTRVLDRGDRPVATLIKS